MNYVYNETQKEWWLSLVKINGCDIVDQIDVQPETVTLVSVDRDHGEVKKDVDVCENCETLQESLSAVDDDGPEDKCLF